MKNIHVLPTDKPSRLYEFGGEYHLQIKSQENFRSQNIYITSDEEIKDGDWVIYKNNFFKIENGDNELFHLSKKIILTDNKDLIKDNVQSIDDTFLEWFVKNPSCEEIRVLNKVDFFSKVNDKLIYKIIIPQEEPKQETLEEAADSYSSNPIFRMGTPRQDIKRGFELGAKWQSERMYNEEDMKQFAEWLIKVNFNYTSNITDIFLTWKEQFKNK
jgi:hypothetical protein